MTSLDKLIAFKTEIKMKKINYYIELFLKNEIENNNFVFNITKIKFNIVYRIKRFLHSKTK